MKRLVLCLACTAAMFAGEFRVGVAAVKITPPPGAPMAGYYFNRAAEGVHDDLYAKALVFESDGAKSALVACDIEELSRPTIEKARSRIESLTGIPAARVMISATHTHTGPVLLGGEMGYNLSGRMLEIAKQYAADLPEKIAEAVRLAAAQMKPARLSASIGREPSLVFNRRFHMKDGAIGWNPGKLNPDIVRPAGPIDPSVPVLYVEAADGKPMAVYVNYALHLDTVGGLEYSADYPYTVSKLLGAAKSPEMVTLFTIGCAGNLNHFDVNWRDPQHGHNEAARIGTILAAEVLKALRKAEAVPAGAPRVRAIIVKLPLPEVSAADLEWAKKITPEFDQPDAAPFLDMVRAFKIVEVARRNGAPVEAEVQVIAIGDQLAFVGLPGEIFTELGMAIKNASPFRYTIIAELANGSIGYVANRKAYQEGNYEPVSAICAEGSGEILVDAATKLLLDINAAH